MRGPPQEARGPPDGRNREIVRGGSLSDLRDRGGGPGPNWAPGAPRGDLEPAGLAPGGYHGTKAHPPPPPPPPLPPGPAPIPPPPPLERLPDRPLMRGPAEKMKAKPPPREEIPPPPPPEVYHGQPSSAGGSSPRSTAGPTGPANNALGGRVGPATAVAAGLGAAAPLLKPPPPGGMLAGSGGVVAPLMRSQSDGGISYYGSGLPDTGDMGSIAADIRKNL